MRARLLQFLPSMAYPLRSLTFPQCAYLTSVYTLETLRVRSAAPSFKAVFSYLEDQGIENPSIIACLRAIAGIKRSTNKSRRIRLTQSLIDTVFSEFLNLMGSKVSTPQREADLADHIEFLLVNFCHPVEAVRKAAGMTAQGVKICEVNLPYRPIYPLDGRAISTSIVEQILSDYFDGTVGMCWRWCRRATAGHD